jgi:TonB family protein
VVREAPPPPAPVKVTPPKLERYAEPRKVDKAGEVVLRLTIDSEGRVTKAEVHRSGGAELDSAALEAAPRLRFRPARKADVPVAAMFLFRYRFEIRTVEREVKREVVEEPAPPKVEPPPPTTAGVIDVTVRGEVPPRDLVKRTLTQREIDRIPGTRGDALRSIQTLPGVARVPGDLGLLIVRGSAPFDTVTFIDGTPVPLIYHFGGLASVVPTELVERIDFYPGNFSARFGRAQGAVIDAGLRSPRTDGKLAGYHGLAQIDLIDARLLAEGPIPLTDKWSFAAAGRRSHVDAVLSAVAGSAGGGVVQAPVYYDYQFMLEYGASRAERFRVAFFGSDDSFELVVPPTEANPTLSGNFEFHTAFQRLQMRYWNTDLPSGGRFSALLAGGRDAVELSLGQAFLLLEVFSLSGRLEVSQPLARGVVVNGGMDLFHGDVDIQLRAPTQVGGGNPMASRPFRAESIERGFSFPATYAELEISPNERSRIVPGVRFDYYDTIDRVDVSPRFNARYDFLPSFPRTTGKVGVGIYKQPPQYQEMVPPLGNEKLRTNHSIHYGIGLEQEITRQLEASGEFFFKQLDDQVDLEVDPRGQGTVFYDNGTRGYAVGGEFLLKYKPDERFFGWLAYTISRSVRQDRPWSDEVLVDFDQPHILSVLGSYELGWGFSFGARFRLVSGNITTPIVCDRDEASCDPTRLDGLYHGFSGRYLIMPRSREEERLPTFHQLDVRVDKKWEFELWKLSLYLDVQNVYNHQNIEGISYNFNYSGRQFATGLPIFPSFGLRGEF